MSLDQAALFGLMAEFGSSDELSLCTNNYERVF